MIGSPQTEILSQLESEVRARSLSCGIEPVKAPDALLEMGAEDRLSVRPPTPKVHEDVEVRESPRVAASRAVLAFKDAALLLLFYQLSSHDFERSYRAALWWAGLVRAKMLPSSRGDLHMLLVAEPGSATSTTWRERRSCIEADERFCRKFVWLPSPSPDQSEIGAFLDRTFLAQPWNSESAIPSSLDPFDGLAETNLSTSLTQEEARQWLARLASAEASSPSQLADDLIALLEQKEDE